jgi:hypothetical protein
MELELVWQIAFIFGMVFFGIWFMHLTNKLNQGLDDISGRGDDLDEIREAVEAVVLILNKLPELMPQFTMNSNPLQPIFEAFAQRLSNQIPLNTVQAPPRDEAGRYGTQTQED